MSVLFAQAAQVTTATTADTNWLAIGLGLAALALVFFALELFIPTGGVLAILCGTSVFGSIASLFIYDTNAGGFALVAYLVAAPFAVVYGIKLWARTPIGRTLILGSTESSLTDGMDEETAAHETAKLRRDEIEALRAMIGKHGTVQTTLRPVGVVVIDGNRLDALAEDGVIDEGAAIEVVDAYDNQLKVRAARQSG